MDVLLVGGLIAGVSLGIRGCVCWWVCDIRRSLRVKCSSVI